MVRVILIIVIVYLLFRLFSRYVIPLLARYFIKKAHQQVQGQNDYMNRKDHDRFSGSGKQPDLGEYIDYEEIKEEKPNQ